MANAGFLAEKNMGPGSKEPFFIIKRDILRAIEKNFEDKIAEMEQQGGIEIEQLTNHVNRKLSEYTNSGFSLFDWRFSQNVLKNLQSLNKIYKTSDKLIFPNIRH